MPPVVHLIAAARPNFMKVAPLWHALDAADWVSPVLVHTGQHYDPNLSAAFIRDLGLPTPHHSLEVGSGSHAEQTAAVMVAYEKLCIESPPACVVVVGDVNSTLACAIAAKKLNLPVAHLEAGLRSFDRTMPEEINRIVTDSICDLLWTPSQDGDEHLLREGVEPSRICQVGNIMIDSLEMSRPKIEAADTVLELGLKAGEFGVATLHRPANVDTPETLGALVQALADVAKKWPVVFPVHPRTGARLKAFGLWETLEKTDGMILTGPLPYIRFMNLIFSARFVVTDSGGLQEETTYLGIPCFTLRPNTERPVTVREGTNRLSCAKTLAADMAKVLSAPVSGSCPKLWDGHTAGRVAASLKAFLAAQGKGLAP